MAGGARRHHLACGDPLTYWDYDYATVLIGDQCWFSENLRNLLYSNGDLIDTSFVHPPDGSALLYRGVSSWTTATYALRDGKYRVMVTGSIRRRFLGGEEDDLLTFPVLDSASARKRQT